VFGLIQSFSRGDFTLEIWSIAEFGWTPAVIGGRETKVAWAGAVRSWNPSARD